MFQVDDEFLRLVGYDIATMSEERKEERKQFFTNELNARLTERLAEELDEAQVDDFATLQDDGDERVRQWLAEFHSDYETTDDYRQLQEVLGEEDARGFYASLLWLQDAVPGYGKIAEELMAEYHEELVKKREMANEALGL